MVEQGERVFVTSHTHMAINNALNKIAREGVPVVKIGRHTQRKDLDDDVPCCGGIADWDARPSECGYVIGATPFATCTRRLVAEQGARAVRGHLGPVGARCLHSHTRPLGAHTELP